MRHAAAQSKRRGEGTMRPTAHVSETKGYDGLKWPIEAAVVEGVK
jgi:hypothetical protein